MQPWSLDRRGIVVLGTRKGIELGEERDDDIGGSGGGGTEISRSMNWLQHSIWILKRRHVTKEVGRNNGTLYKRGMLVAIIIKVS